MPFPPVWMKRRYRIAATVETPSDFNRYSRIIARIEKEFQARERNEARTILEWVGCASFPPTVKEIQSAVSIYSGVEPTRGIQGSLLNIVQRCGPILEILNSNVQFVHFTAKE